MAKVLSQGTFAGEQGDPVNKFGLNPDLDTGVIEDFWPPGGPFPFDTFAAAQTMEIVSTSAADAAAGTGARTVTVSGLDGVTGEEKSETVTLNGITAVVLTGTWLAINRAFVVTSGSGNVNAGDLNIQVSPGGQVTAQIPAGDGQTQQAVYRVPANHFLIVNNYQAGFVGVNNGTVAISVLSVAADLSERRRGNLTLSVNYANPREYPVGGIRINSLEWVSLRTSFVSANNIAAAAEFDGVLYNNAQDG